LICVLEVRTFQVTHFYGSLHLFDGDEELGRSHTLTYALGILQARAMNRAHGIAEDSKTFLWSPGAECNAFFSEQAVVDAAKEVWKAVFPAAVKLVRGKRSLAGYELVRELERDAQTQTGPRPPVE